QGDLVTNLAAEKQANPTAYPGDPRLLNVAIMQRNALAKKISNANSESDALLSAKNALAEVKNDPNLKGAPAGTLVSALNGLLNVSKANAAEIQQLTNDRDDMSKKLAAVNAAFKTQLSAKQEDITK